MDLRQVLEAGAHAAFAIANTDPALFVTEDKQGLLNSSPKLTRQFGQCLNANHRGLLLLPCFLLVHGLQRVVARFPSFDVLRFPSQGRTGLS